MAIKTYLVRSTESLDSIKHFDKFVTLKFFGYEKRHNFFHAKNVNLRSIAESNVSKIMYSNCILGTGWH